MRIVFWAIHTLLSIKAARPPKIRYHNSQFSMTETNNKEKEMDSLSEIQITEGGNRRIGNDRLLKLISSSDLLYSLTLTTVNGCYHSSCLTSDKIWVSDGHNLILTNINGFPLHYVKDLCSDLSHGLHTVNSGGELIDIDKGFNINNLSTNMKTTTKLIKKKANSRWKPQCVYLSPFTGDLLVGLY